MNRKVLLVFLYSYALVFSVAKAIRFPNSWSKAHWMLDYRFGFIKRGLAGEIFGLFFQKSECNIVLISSIILALLYILLVVIAVKETYRNTQDIIRKTVFYLIFFLSQYMVFSAHLIGYLDHVIFLLTILAVQLITHKKILLASLLMAISIFVHEISFFLMFPISFFAVVVNEIPDGQFSLKSSFTKGLLKKTALFLLLPVIATAGILVYQELYGHDYHSVLFNYLKHIEFVGNNVAGSVSGAYTGKFSEYLAEEGPHFFQRIFRSKASIMDGIPILFLLYTVYSIFRKIDIYLFLLFAAVALFPLLLHAIAWDTYRIWTFPYMVLFLGFWILSSRFKNQTHPSQKISLLEIIICIISILLVALVPNILMDDEVERFSLLEKSLTLLPVFGVLYYVKASEKVS